jgi:hypothetical protein
MPTLAYTLVRMLKSSEVLVQMFVAAPDWSLVPLTIEQRPEYFEVTGRTAVTEVCGYATALEYR